MTYPSPRGPMQPEITIGAFSVSYAARTSSRISTARLFSAASCSEEWPRRSAQSAFARHVAVSRTMPTPWPAAMWAYGSK